MNNVKSDCLDISGLHLTLGGVTEYFYKSVYN